MHPHALAVKTATARERITAAAQTLGAQLGLDPQWARALDAAKAKDAQIAIARQWEAVADLLEQIAARVVERERLERENRETNENRERAQIPRGKGK